jgi:hypothetical protein
MEYLDRIADPDNPLSAMVPYIGTYRAQEFLTTQVLAAMVGAEIDKIFDDVSAESGKSFTTVA